MITMFYGHIIASFMVTTCTEKMRNRKIYTYVNAKIMESNSD